MRSSVKNLFLYAGLDKKEYHELLPAIRKENQTYLQIYCGIALGILSVLVVAGLIFPGFMSVNIAPFLLFILILVLILLSTRFFIPRHAVSVFYFVYLFEALLYSLSLIVSLLHPDMTAVSAIAFLLVTPLLFYDRPAHQACITVAVAVIFYVIVRHFKAPAVANADMWNLISYSMVSIAEGLFVMRTKMQSLSQDKKIVYLSETDLLTGVKNRNCYENRLKRYPEQCRTGLLCVYADVNGLHELNNNSGHEAGDRMLKTVAEEIRQQYGREHTYRIGGDEFVAFGPDQPLEGTEAVLAAIGSRLGEKNYHVSFGVSYGEMPVENMEALVKRAEEAMYRAKSEYYRQPEHSRRKRR